LGEESDIISSLGEYVVFAARLYYYLDYSQSRQPKWLRQHRFKEFRQRKSGFLAQTIPDVLTSMIKDT